MIFTVLISTCLLALGQGHDQPMPEGMKNVAFLQGDWSGKQNFVTGGAPLIGDVAAHFHEAIGGRYIEESLVVTIPGRKPSDTRHFLTFDPKTGHYLAWWFNDASTGAMELEGTVTGTKLVLESKPKATAVGPGTIFRATYEAKGKGLTYGLEMKMGAEWQSLFTTTYERAK